MDTGEDHRATASDGVVAVERTVDLQKQGVIVRLTVSTDREGEIPVTVEDELPAGLDPKKVAFHPKHAPEDGEATPAGVTFEGVVSADEDLVVVYGAQVDTAEVSEMALTDSRLAVDSDAPDEGGSVRGLLGRLFGRKSSPDEPDTTPSGPMDEFESFPGEDESQPTETPTEELESAVTRIEPDDSDESETDSDDLVDEAEPDPEPMVSDTPDTTDDRDEPSDESTAADSTTSVAAMLADEIESGEVAEEDLDVIREELDIELSGSQAARLNHVQSRMDEFAAYADALRTLLDEEGDPTEVVTELREEIRALREDVGDLQSAVGDLEVELATATDEREALREDIDAAAAEVAAIEDEFGEELDAVGDEFADEIERVERQARAAREGVKSDLADLEATVERVAKLHDAIESAFGPAAEAETESADVSESSETENEEPPETQEYGADGGIDLAAVEDTEDDPAEGDSVLDL